MKRALLLTYYLPPNAAVASARAHHLCESLQQHGWDVIPVLPEHTGVVDFKTPARRLLGVQEDQTTHDRFHVTHGSVLTRRTWKQSAIEEGHKVLSFANGRLGWLGPGIRAVQEIVRNERIDAIISTSPPEGTHMVAARSRGAIPWVADLRDPWLRNDDLGGPRWMRQLDRLLEAQTLRGASALTTVSEPIAQTLRARYPNLRVDAIPNCFSSNDWNDRPFTEPRRATFVHAGQLYRGRCDPRPFFAALASLLERGDVRRDEVRVDLYGERESWLESLVDAYGLDDVVVRHGKKPRSEILERLRGATRLVIFVRNGPDERGTYTGKLFEYLGARRKILAVGGPSEETVMDDALKQSSAGVRHRTSDTLRAEILQAVTEWRSGKTSQVSAGAVAPFELRHFGERFAALLEDITCNG